MVTSLRGGSRQLKGENIGFRGAASLVRVRFLISDGFDGNFFVESGILCRGDDVDAFRFRRNC